MTDELTELTEQDERTRLYWMANAMTFRTTYEMAGRVKEIASDIDKNEMTPAMVDDMCRNIAMAIKRDMRNSGHPNFKP